MTIPIRNLYFIFCYAWSKFPPGDVVDRGVDESPDLPNLLARMLIAGLNRLLRRGIDRGYVEREEETRSPRGRLQLPTIVKQQTLRRGLVVCAADDLTENVLHNQILKATARTLSQADGVEKSYARELRMLAKNLRQVADVRLSASSFSTIQLSRHSREYRPLLRLCELIFRALIPDETTGATRFADIQEDDESMSTIFEEFLRNFYAHEQSVFSVGREVLRWKAEAQDTGALRYLPRMHTDITMTSPAQKIVADAKYYTKALNDRYEQHKLHSDNLFQLYAYLRHTSTDCSDAGVRGMLIYPAVNGDQTIEFQIDGFPIKVEIVDLTRPWGDIRVRLLSALPLKHI